MVIVTEPNGTTRVVDNCPDGVLRHGHPTPRWYHELTRDQRISLLDAAQMRWEPTPDERLVKARRELRTLQANAADLPFKIIYRIDQLALALGVETMAELAMKNCWYRHIE